MTHITKVVRFLVITWRDSRGPRAGALLASVRSVASATVWTLLDNSQCEEGSPRFALLTAGPDPLGLFVVGGPTGMFECRRLDLPDDEPIRYGGDSYWERATPIEGGHRG